MDRMDRRGFLECAAWTGAAVVWTASGGVLSSRLAARADAAEGEASTFSFVQISDTHVGFKGQANPDAAATLQQVIDRVNALPTRPAFVLHTGDQTHGQKAGAFDTVAELLKGVKTERTFYVPGEHDVFLDGGKEYLGRYGQGTVGGRGTPDDRRHRGELRAGQAPAGSDRLHARLGDPLQHEAGGRAGKRPAGNPRGEPAGRATRHHDLQVCGLAELRHARAVHLRAGVLPYELAQGGLRPAVAGDRAGVLGGDHEQRVAETPLRVA